MEKQIEKIANDLRDLDNLQYNPNYTANYQRAVGLHSLGYRKQSDTAREIFAQLEEEIEPALASNYRVYEKYLNAQDSPTLLRIGGKIDALRGIYCFIEDLKKKYGVTDDGNF